MLSIPPDAPTQDIRKKYGRFRSAEGGITGEVPKSQTFEFTDYMFQTLLNNDRREEYDRSLTMIYRAGTRDRQLPIAWSLGSDAGIVLDQMLSGMPTQAAQQSREFAATYDTELGYSEEKFQTVKTLYKQKRTAKQRAKYRSWLGHRSRQLEHAFNAELTDIGIVGELFLEDRANLPEELPAAIAALLGRSKRMAEEALIYRLRQRGSGNPLLLPPPGDTRSVSEAYQQVDAINADLLARIDGTIAEHAQMLDEIVAKKSESIRALLDTTSLKTLSASSAHTDLILLLGSNVSLDSLPWVPRSILFSPGKQPSLLRTLAEFKLSDIRRNPIKFAFDQHAEHATIVHLLHDRSVPLRTEIAHVYDTLRPNRSAEDKQLFAQWAEKLYNPENKWTMYY